MTVPSITAATSTRWPAWQRIGFRFAFVYLLLQVAPWRWIGYIPGGGALITPIERGIDAAVQWANRAFFHVADPLVMPNGSGDTSWAWAQLQLYLWVAAIACVVWSIADRARPAYPRLGYALRTMVRYYIATFALSYGLIKVFALQMGFPTLSQMATPLGDLLPMRLAWMFVGYSTPYQVFSGVAETVAGLLLLSRRTVTLGLIAAVGAFANVVMINLGYDVPVKLFASHLLLACTFLLALDAPRLLGFLALNRAAPGTALYDPPWSGTRARVLHGVAKVVMVVILLVLPAWSDYQTWERQRHPVAAVPLPVGVYDVTRFVVHGDTIPPLVADTLRWRDVVIDNNVQGSIGTTDTLFWQRYRRGHFRFRADTAGHELTVWRTSFRLDSVPAFTARYELMDTAHARLWTTIRGESVYVELTRASRHFQLAERQFHWRSEYNR